MSRVDSLQRLAAAVAAGFILMAGAPAAAQDADAVEKRWAIEVIGFFPDADANFTIFSTVLDEPVKVDYEDDLLVNGSAEALRLNAGVRLSRSGRHLLEFAYLKIDRNGRAVLDENLEFGDITFPVNITVDSDVKTQDFDLHYTYLVVKKEKGELGLSIGLHGIKVETSVSGVLGGGVLTAATEKVSREFPLPLIGIRGAYDFSRHWGISGGARLLSFKVEDIEGSFLDAYARLEYRVSDTVALGLGYAIIDADVERKPGDNTTPEIIQAAYRYKGPEAMLRFSF